MADLLTEEMRAYLQSARDSMGVDLTQEELNTVLQAVEDARCTPEDDKARVACSVLFTLFKDAFERRGWSIDAPPTGQPGEEDPPPSLTRS